MTRRWERFIHGPKTRGNDELHVTINKKSHFFLNRRAWDLLGSPDAAVLMIDRDCNSIIGIEPAHRQKEGAFPFKIVGRSTYMLNASSFCQNHGIRVNCTEAFLNPEVDEEGILTLDLRTTRRISMPKRVWKGKPVAAKEVGEPSRSRQIFEFTPETRLS